MRLLGITGSLRKDSYNKKLLRACAKLLPAEVQFETGDIGDLPLFNQDDVVERYPASAQALKDAIRVADGIIIATPEYSRSIPGVLKNALDWSNRPYGESAWTGKPVLVTGATAGSVGTALAQYDLKKVLLASDARVSTEELFIGKFNDRFDATGNITDPKTEELLRKGIEKFLVFVVQAR